MVNRTRAAIDRSAYNAKVFTVLSILRPLATTSRPFIQPLRLASLLDIHLYGRLPLQMMSHLPAAGERLSTLNMDVLPIPILPPSVVTPPEAEDPSSTLDMDSPDLESSTTKASLATLFFDSSSPRDADNSNIILDRSLPEPLDSDSAATFTVERKQGPIWLAATPLSFFSTLRYSRRDKLYVIIHNIPLPSSYSSASTILETMRRWQSLIKSRP